MLDQPPRRRRRFSAGPTPDPVDLHVGGRIRLLRRLRGLSQSDLAARLGCTFQQVQKYEKGANRISASVLARVARVLDLPISVFFDGMDDARPLSSPDCDTSRAAMELMRAFHALPAPLRRHVLGLVKEMAGEG